MVIDSIRGIAMIEQLQQKIMSRQPLAPEETEYVKQEAQLVPWLRTKASRDEQKKLIFQAIHALKTEDMALMIRCLNQGLLFDVNSGGAMDEQGNPVDESDVEDKQIDNIYLSPNGKIFLTTSVKLKGGYQYSAPVTKGRGGGTDEVVFAATIHDFIDKLEAQLAMIDIMNDQVDKEGAK